jgi:hypothetical protein
MKHESDVPPTPVEQPTKGRMLIGILLVGAVQVALFGYFLAKRPRRHSAAEGKPPRSGGLRSKLRRFL